MPTKSRSLTTTKGRIAPLHPGEVLREEFMLPLGLSSNRLALDLRVPATRITEIVNQRRGITADTALRLARYFRTSPHFWLSLQAAHDLSVTQARFGAEIEARVQPMPGAILSGAAPAQPMAA